MSAFQKGDLVIVIESSQGHLGKVGTVESRCGCVSAIILATKGFEVYKVGGLSCYVHTALKKIGGERPPEAVETTRDEPVAA